jgi:TraL protein
MWKLTKVIRASIVTAALCWATAASAGCASGDAATRGSQIGFSRAQNNAQQIAMNQTTAQSLLQKCLEGLAQQNIMSMFPSLSSIFASMVQQVCYAATNKVNSVVGEISPTSEINQAISTATGGLGAGGSMKIGGSGAALPSNTTTPPSNFWNNIWN